MSVDTQVQMAIESRLQFIGMGEEQKRQLKGLAPVIAGSIGPALDVFYAKASKEPETARFFADPAHMRHAREMQINHWNNLATARFDDTYVQAVTRVGKTHARLGLEPRWYIGGYTMIIEGIVRAVVAKATEGYFARKIGPKLADDLVAVIKAAMIDLDQGISIYLDVIESQRQQAEAISKVKQSERDQALSALEKGLKALAGGNLADRIDDDLATDFAELKRNFNETVDNMEAAMTGVLLAAREAADNSQQLVNATGDMSRRSEQQASSLEETAAAIEEITTISREASTRTSEARSLVTKTSEEAGRSSGVVRDAVGAMEAIESSSQKITQIIGVIDDISFQTNLLALNAGVEAARAGEAGKGFAVVAQEVRELAQRSASAAREIRELIGRSSADVTKGVELVSRAGTALGAISGQIASINDAIGSIAHSAQEQSSGIGEINSAVSNMDQITQKNAALMEEIDAATHSLQEVSTRLLSLVGRFRVRDQKPAHGAQWRRAG